MHKLTWIIMKKADVIIIGAGLSGLSTALQCKKNKLSYLILEKSPRIGGQIKTYHTDGFTFESGPNSGAAGTQEVLELFDGLDCEMEYGNDKAKKRLIWKDKSFHALPSNPIQGLFTPLFTLKDKFRILGEPFRAKGDNPNESVAEIARRRLGQSYVDYAVDPFISGIYAGDPYSLVTKYALPKLYNLEQNYGSFIKGAIAKAKEAKSSIEVKNAKASKKAIFSVKGGMENLIKALVKELGEENILTDVENISLKQIADYQWSVNATQKESTLIFSSKHIVSTIGAHSLSPLLAFIDKNILNQITNIRYAPVIQAAVAIKDRGNLDFNAFGGLISSKDKEDFLGILYPSSCFSNRCPEKAMLFSFFMGGIKHTDFMQLTDNQIEDKINTALHRMLAFPIGKKADWIKIFRHQYAIPQYEQSSKERLEAIKETEKQYKGLHIAGNLRDGVGMAHRIAQAKIIINDILGSNHV